MNDNAKNNPPAPSLVQDVTPPRASTDLIQAEIEHNIPVKEQERPVNDPATNNVAVAAQQPKAAAVEKHPAVDSKNTKADSKAKASRTIPVATITFAVLVAIGLAAAAFYAFKNDQPKTAQKAPASTQAPAVAADTSIQTKDLDDFSASLQSKINQLNDERDFSSSDLSEQALGL